MDFGKKCLALLLAFSLSPVMTHAIEANNADILLNTDVKHINVIVNPGGGGGCSSGQYWDIGQGRCTSEVLLRSVNVTQSCSCDCGSGATGSCTSQQNGIYQVYGWRLPTAGNELISRTTSTSWGGCYQTSSNCVPAPTEPSGSLPGAPGTTIGIVSNDLICDASNPYFSDGGATTTQKYLIISAYKQHTNGFGRCPESNYAGFAGWSQWQSRLTVDGWSIAQVSELIKTSTVTDAEVRTVVNAACTVAANKTYGVNYVSSTYIMGSGNGCTVLF